ncbi:TetR/AcrR family transcriptional regulator [Mixta gaviniae]|uniref:TetR family transcriptional regulator n=1 Tax=Mixta gaviniae TaxID=665914 RepID=A0A2L0IG27_9GAMM|nr:TetR/AcrR family transcriptional regulator [Mixta gaviniae]AUX93548.1 TetR family transcriptional regulator [Mixta gaviniae]
MIKKKNAPLSSSPVKRLTKAERRQQLLETALLIVREEYLDSLTLGRLAERAGVSKPVVYDHFPTRSALLIELYKWIDTERVSTFAEMMSKTHKNAQETTEILASAYILCAADKKGEFHVIGAALAGSEEKTRVFQELLDNCVAMFVSVLAPHVDISPKSLQQLCIGLVGAGEALSVAISRGHMQHEEAVEAFTTLINGIVQPGVR